MLFLRSISRLLYSVKLPQIAKKRSTFLRTNRRRPPRPRGHGDVSRSRNGTETAFPLAQPQMEHEVRRMMNVRKILDTMLEVPQRSRTADTYRRLAKLMAGLGWTAVRVRDLTRVRIQRTGPCPRP
jgi:hypothetical protein